MLTTSWHRLMSRRDLPRRSSLSPRLRRYCPRVEGLEDRTLLTVSFGPPVNYTVARPQQIVVDDFNNDSLSDMVVVSYPDALNDYQGGGLTVFMNDVPHAGQPDHPGQFEATFTHDINLPAEGVPVVVNHFDQASPSPEIVFLDQDGNTLSMLRWNGNGTFVSAGSIAATPGSTGFFASNHPNCFVAGDYNGDGKLDLAVGIDAQPAQGVYVLLGNGNGTFRDPILAYDNVFPRDMVAADFDRDGKQDLAVLDGFFGDVEVLRGNGDGTFFDWENGIGFPRQAPYNVGGPSSLAVGDFDRDGHADLAVAGGGGLNILLSRTDIFEFDQKPAVQVPGFLSPSGLTVHDFDGDGFADVAMTFGGGAVLTNGGNGYFQLETSIAHGDDSAAWGFFNNDNAPDLVVASGLYSTITVYMNQPPVGSIVVAPLSPFDTGAPGPFSAFVTAYDNFGDKMPGYTGTVHFVSTDPQAVLPSDYPFTSTDAGSHAFAFHLYSPGFQEVTATDTSDPTIFGVPGDFTVLPPITLSGPSSIVAGVPFSLSVKVMDASGANPDPTYRGTVTFTSSDPAAQLPAPYTFTNADQGVHTFNGPVLFTAAAPAQTIVVTDTEQQSSAGFEYFTGDLSLVVKPAPATHMQLGLPANLVAGIPFDMTARLLDDYGNIATGYLGTVTFASSDTAAVLPPPYTFTVDDRGVHTFHATLQTGGSLSVSGTGTTASITATALVNNPVPATTSLSAGSIAEGTPGTTLAVIGTGFVTASVVEWNGIPLTTTIVNSSKLLATVPAQDLAEEGAAAVTVVNPTPGGGASNPQLFTVTDALLTAQGVALAPVAGAPFNGVVASFTDANPGGMASEFTALISWGDGSASAGVVTPDGSGGFNVTGSTTYAAAGSYAISVQILDAGGSMVTAAGTAAVVNLGVSVGKGQSAGIGFWQSKNGQTLIASFNGGSGSTALGNWLAATFANLYAPLAGRTNSQVAAYYSSLFNRQGPKLEAEVLDTALDLYATTQSLGGTTAVSYGFQVTAAGLGASSENVGQTGAAFGVPNNTTLNVYQILKAVNAQAVNGVLYDDNELLQDLALLVFQDINKRGGI